MIYILLSIKTRIETEVLKELYLRYNLFISYYPLKQGLKLCFPRREVLFHSITVWFQKHGGSATAGTDNFTL